MSKKVYKTSKVQQLIDLNEDLTNFKLRFNLTSKNNEEFDMAIADQYTIDNTPEEIVFKKVKNTISGTIVSDKNVFQNHFLILKSSGENHADVEVLINKQEIPPNPEAQQEQKEETKQEKDMRESRGDMTGENIREMRGENIREMRENRGEMRENRGETREMRGENIRQIRDTENYENETKTTWIDIRLIIVVLICILGGIFVYNIVSKKNGITTSLPEVNPPLATPLVPPASFSFKPQNMNMNLLNKLNSNIPLRR